jgi:hypothetical protein
MAADRTVPFGQAGLPDQAYAFGVRDWAFVFEPLRRFAGVLLQQGRVQVDTDSDEYEYVRMRRFPLAILRSLDQALGSKLFAPTYPKARTQPCEVPHWSDKGAHDPGITMIELLASAADQLSAYADEVAAEARLRTRRRTVVAAGAGILVLRWWCRRPRP